MYTDPRGGHNRKSFNKDFFKSWSPQMAYVLGLVYSDGTIEDVRKSSRTCYLGITSKDKDLVLDVQKVMSSQHNLYHRREHKYKFPNQRAGTSKENWTLRIGSKKLFDDLVKLGIEPRKSLSLKFPKISNEYVSFFIRGYFDGDGSISTYIPKGRKSYRVRITFTCGSKQFLKFLSKRINKMLGISDKNIYFQHAYKLIYNKHDSLKVLKFLYKNLDKAPYLDRKYNKYQEYLETL